ncbi:MAG: acylphosphatase [Patescibacteria group bacterium]|nr:acylphosphatase [Patescibacteria group bacterium]
MKQVHLLITGFVQGVGYRKFVRHEARKRGITGWVRNLKDGSVEALAVGIEVQLKELIAECYKGPFLSQVDNIHEEWEEEHETFEEFSVKHDI